MDTPAIPPPAGVPAAPLNLTSQNNNAQQNLAQQNQTQQAQALTQIQGLVVQNNEQMQAQTEAIVSRLPVGVTITGQMIGSDKNGNILVRLAGSDLLLSSPIALSKNSQLALRLDNVSGSLAMQLLSVDGKTPASQPQSVSNQLQQNPQAVPVKIVAALLNPNTTKTSDQPSPVLKSDVVTLTSPQTNIAKGIVIDATPEVIQGLRANLPQDDDASPSKLMDALSDETKVGAQVNLKITNVQQPPQQQQVQTDNSALAKQDWMKDQNPQKQSDPQTTKVQSLQQQLEDYSPTIKQLPNGNVQMNAIVIATKQNGEMLVETPMGKVIINGGQQAATIAKGSVLTLELTNISAPEKAEFELPADGMPLQQMADSWPALKTLTQYADNIGLPQLAQNLAGIDPTLASRMASFMNAVKTGNLRGWLGENNYNALNDDETGSGLLAKLKGDIENLRQLYSQNNNGWQTMLFPVYDGRDLHQARLHVKYLPDENNKPDKSAGTRFIVEIDTSHFGEVQLDGLVRGNISKHFDLMVRTHNPLDLDVQDDIRHIFSSAAEITGFRGDLEFSTMREFPVNLLDRLVETNLSNKINHKGLEA